MILVTRYLEISAFDRAVTELGYQRENVVRSPGDGKHSYNCYQHHCRTMPDTPDRATMSPPILQLPEQLHIECTGCQQWNNEV